MAFAWVSLGGFQAALADNGGPYRSRAAAMATVVFGGGLGCLIGSLAGLSPWLAVPWTFAAALLSGMVRVYGNNGSVVGLANLVVFLVAVASPLPTLAAAGTRAGLFVAGGAASGVLALLLWPFHPYLPARRPVAEVWRMLSARIVATNGLPSNHEIREQLEEANRQLVAVRASRDGTTRRGEALLATLVGADRTFGVVNGVPDVLATTGVAPPPVLGDASVVAASIANVVLGKRAAADTSRLASERAGLPGDATRVLEHLTSEIGIAAAVAVGIDHDVAAPINVHGAGGRPHPRTFSDVFLAPLRASWAPGSLVARHALRLAVGVTGAHLLSTALGLPRGYWMTLTTAVILQPYAGATMHRALQRVIGTILGGVLAAALTTVVHGALAVSLVLVPLCVMTIAARPLGYTWFVMFLTPLFVIITEGTHTDPRLAFVRMLNTLLGGALALASGAALWPDWEGDSLNDALAAAVQAVRAYLRAALTGAPSTPAARRASGLASNNANVVLQRIVSEGDRSAARVAPGLALVTFVRRLAATTSALVALRAPETLGPFSDAADAALADMAQALQHGTAPAPAVDLASAKPRQLSSPTVSALLDQIARQIDVLHHAIAAR